MKRISVMANDSFLVDAIASILAVELCPDVLQLTYGLPGDAYETLGDHRSIVILIDEGGSKFDLLKAVDSSANSPLLVIKADLKSSNIKIHKSYPLANPCAEQVTRLVRDFRITYLGRIAEEVLAWAA